MENMHQIKSMYRITCDFGSLQNTDPFRGTQEENVCLEDVPVLPTDPDDYYEDTDISVD